MLAEGKDAVLTQTKTVVAQAQERLVGAVVQVPSGAPAPPPASNNQLPTAGVRPLQDPEPSGRARRLEPQRILREARAVTSSIPSWSWPFPTWRAAGTNHASPKLARSD